MLHYLDVTLNVCGEISQISQFRTYVLELLTKEDAVKHALFPLVGWLDEVIIDNYISLSGNQFHMSLTGEDEGLSMDEIEQQFGSCEQFVKKLGMEILAFCPDVEVQGEAVAFLTVSDVTTEGYSFSSAAGESDLRVTELELVDAEDWFDF